MGIYDSGCMVCGKKLVYQEKAVQLQCVYCGAQGHSNAVCTEGHYVCDGCHSKKGIETIKNYVLVSDSNNPLKMAVELMRKPYINMHGPEHHFLIPAVLIGAYKNAGGTIEDIEASIEECRVRSSNVPGGICGLWGSCGAAVGAGIYISIVLGASPLSKEEWGLANRLTGRCLENISKTGGPRCCKRNAFTAIKTAVEFTKEYLGIEMADLEQLKCGFFNKNNECLNLKCPYYPIKQ